MEEKQLKIFESGNLWKSIFQMTVPTLFAILVMLVYNMADMFFVGQTGITAQVAAISIAGPVFNLIMAAAMLLSGGGSVIISRDLGAKDTDHARMVSSLCLWTAILLGILAGVLIILFQNPLLRFLGAKEDTTEYARSYMVILAMGSPFLLISNMFAQIIRAEGSVKDGLIGNLLGTLVNMILDPVFILNFRMGAAGAAIATVLGNIISSLYYWHYMRKKAAVLNADLSSALKNPAYIFTIMAIGLPNAASSFLSGFSGSFANRLLSGYGSQAIAANAAAGRVNLIIVMILMGLSLGTQPLLSYHFGAGNLKKLSGVLKRLILLSVLFGLLSAGFVLIFKSTVIGLFLKETSAALQAESILSVLMLSSPLIGFCFLSVNFLQATGKAMTAVFLSILQKGLLYIPLLFLFEHLMGFEGIILASVVSDMISILVSILLMRMEWQRITAPKRCPANPALSAG